MVLEAESLYLWHKSLIALVKCNSNAALFHDTNCTSMDVIFRDSHGMFLGSRTKKIDGCPLVQKCEALALLDAIYYAKELGFYRVKFEIDAKILVDAIHSSFDNQSEFCSIIYRC